MAARTVGDAWTTFTANIAPTEAQKKMINQRRATADGVLRKAFADSNMPLQQTRLIGSAGRVTMIRPLNDVDVFAIFDDSVVWNNYRGDSTKLLYRVRDALNSEYSIKVGARRHAIRLFFEQPPHVEIVPAFAYNTGGYVIPGAKANWPWDSTWQNTDPDVHATFFATRNKELSMLLKPLIRVLKCWNRAHSARFSSFHLEVVVQASFGRIGTSERQSVHEFFDWSSGRIHAQDPAGYSGDLAKDFSWLKFQDIKSSLKTAYEQSGRALEAEAKGDHKTSIGLWRTLLGDEFPAYG